MICVFRAAAGVALALSAAPALNHNAAIAAPAAALPKSKPTLASHKATYQLSLLKTVPGEGVRAARGTMIYTLADRCDGYTIESNISMDLLFADGNRQRVDQRYAAWEAKNGSFSSFTMRSLENGETSKSYRGTISLGADGSGTATYEADKTTDFKLPAGTMLSTAHTIALLETAAAGNRFYRVHVIDGSFDRGPFVITALISGTKDASSAVEKGGELSAGRYFPMSLAYFPASSRDAVPEYELGMDLLTSGISRSMVQDFGDFAIGFKLIDIEPLKPEC